MESLAEMAQQSQVRTRIVAKVGGWLGVVMAALVALLSYVPMAYASNSAPAGWDVQINDYTRGPNYTDWTLTLPAGYDHVKWYLYTSTDDATPYHVQESGVLTPDANGEVHTTLYDMQGGGNVTYIKATAVDDAGDETPLPANFFVLQLDVAVYIDGISPDVLAELQSAFQDFEDATPVGQVTQAATDLQDAVDGMSFSEGGGGDLAFTVPIVQSQYGNVYATLFSEDELQKLTWLSLVRTGLQAMMWITFVLWMIQRFAPMFKA